MSENQVCDTTVVRVATWNMDHWKRKVDQRERAWDLLRDQNIDVALLQETVPPTDLPRHQCAYREIGGSRGWGSAVVSFHDEWTVEEIQTVRTRYSGHRFSMLGTHPGAVMVAKVDIPKVGPLTLVSVYGAFDGPYAQTSMLRTVADLIPLFDSPHGESAILGGDFNLSTCGPPSDENLKRYGGILGAVYSLGLQDLTVHAKQRPPRWNCPCGATDCQHLPTYRGKGDGQAISQLDHLLGTPSLAVRCQRISLLEEESRGLSDHVPIVAELELPNLERSLSPEGFLQEVELRAGREGRRVVEELIAWAGRKQGEFERGPVGGIDLMRLPITQGSEPEMFLQLDVGREHAEQWTCSVLARGEVEMKFQRLRAPFDDEAMRESVWSHVNDIVGSLEKRLNGRPRFRLNQLYEPAKLQAFLSVLDSIVDGTVKRLEEERSGR